MMIKLIVDLFYHLPPHGRVGIKRRLRPLMNLALAGKRLWLDRNIPVYVLEHNGLRVDYHLIFT